MVQDTRHCKGCGESIRRTQTTGPVQHYCSPNCRPRCSIEGCEKVRHGNVYCSEHHTRWKKTGDPLTPLKFQRNFGNCSVIGCDRPMRKTGWCASHYAQQQKSGKPPEPFKYKWGQVEPRPYIPSPKKLKPQLCVVCGSASRTIKSHRFCSISCKAFYYLHGGVVPTEVKCAQCRCVIDLTIRHANGRRKRSTLRLCEKCVPWTWRCAGVTVADLAQRDGTDCSICGEPVDMSLGRNDSFMCASIDHVLPRSRGGSDDPSNLKLAHLICNCKKSDQILISA